MASDPIQQLTRADIEARAESLRQPWHANYYAMYSSILGGIVTDPLLMQVPADDHVVHRGDGVFETIKCVDGALYGLKPHLARLLASAAAVRILPPLSMDRLESLLPGTVRAGGQRNALVRLILSRGPGGFGVNPAECPRSVLYIIAYRLPPSFMETHPEGARVIRSRLPVKPSLLATAKTCNYLLNALMKQEANEAGSDFALGFDERGFLAESATENVGLVTEGGELVFPNSGRILEGITMSRVRELASRETACGFLSAVRRADLREDDLRSASEILIFGTTPDVTSVTTYDGRPVGNGQPGPVRARLQERLLADILHNPELRTPCFDPD
ncbi:MAG: aminotransferase class IV [Kiritimatiellia bacterium]|nr:aminotransferase class IV [Kiritimatiellia bacterium]